jgi:hypothetical protein
MPTVPLAAAQRFCVCFVTIAALRNRTKGTPMYGLVVGMPVIPGALQLAASGLRLTLIRKKGSRFQEASGNIDLSEMRWLVASGVITNHSGRSNNEGMQTTYSLCIRVYPRRLRRPFILILY